MSFSDVLEKPVPRDHRLSSLGKPRDAKRRSSGRIFLSHLTLKIYSYKSDCLLISKGIGHDLAKQLHRSGFTVFAGCLKPEGDGADKLKGCGDDRMFVVPLDIRKEDSVQNALRIVVENLPEHGTSFCLRIKYRSKQRGPEQTAPKGAV